MKGASSYEDIIEPLISSKIDEVYNYGMIFRIQNENLKKAVENQEFILSELESMPNTKNVKN
jgi:hypothetical protein